MIRRSALLAVAALVVPALAAQAPARARLEGRVPLALLPVVDSLVADAAARDLPTEPLIRKALEGGAKGVPADRIAVALRVVSERLAAAATAIDAAGAPRTADGIQAGEFAMTAGLAAADVSALARAAGDEPATALRVAGTLAALGVPPAETVALVTFTAQNASAEVVSLPQMVEGAIARGATPAQAARLARQAGARGGPHGPPPDRPGRPNPRKP